ncbi:hypothetical protein VTK26DRAFT_8194 [Humicola hyalothermophila]
MLCTVFRRLCFFTYIRRNERINKSYRRKEKKRKENTDSPKRTPAMQLSVPRLPSLPPEQNLHAKLTHTNTRHNQPQTENVSMYIQVSESHNFAHSVHGFPPPTLPFLPSFQDQIRSYPVLSPNYKCARYHQTTNQSLKESRPKHIPTTTTLIIYTQPTQFFAIPLSPFSHRGIISSFFFSRSTNFPLSSLSLPRHSKRRPPSLPTSTRF